MCLHLPARQVALIFNQDLKAKKTVSKKILMFVQCTCLPEVRGKVDNCSSLNGQKYIYELIEFLPAASKCHRPLSATHTSSLLLVTCSKSRRDQKHFSVFHVIPFLNYKQQYYIYFRSPTHELKVFLQSMVCRFFFLVVLILQRYMDYPF